LKIAILGTGNVGGTLGRRLAQKGHLVVFGSRDPTHEGIRGLLDQSGPNATVKPLNEAIDGCEVVILATPWPAAEGVLKAVGNLDGKVLIDCINPLNATFSGLDLGFSESAGERIARWAPTARVVKCFNSISAATMADPGYEGTAATVFYCGDDTEAKRVTHRLAEDLGLDPVDSGPLLNARYLEPFAMLYIHLAVREGWGSNCAFRIMKRNSQR
jgi:8-hydroxy-5-deazaflavin:NADPH oxidoreductase